MTNRNTILNELADLGSELPVATTLKISMQYLVDYFEGFAIQILNRIKALEATDAKEELKYFLFALEMFLKKCLIQFLRVFSESE